MELYISHKPTCCKIYLLQERAVRIILAADYSAPGKPLFKNLVFLTVTVCILFRFKPSCTCITMKCCLALLLNLFQTGSQIHNYSIRYAELYCPQVCRTNIKQFTILYQEAKLWNSLPHSIIESNNMKSIKQLLKSFLINLQYTQWIL